MADLSQEEVDRQLDDNPSSTEETTGTAVEQGPVEPYDFKRPNRIPKEQKSTITLILESYAQAAAVNLSAFLRSEVLLHLQDVEQLSYQEYAMSLSNPTCVATFDMQPLSGLGCVEVNAPLVFTIIDKMLGGDGTPPELARNFTDIELSIARKLLNIMLTNLSESWSHILTIAFGLKDVETNPAFIRAIPAREACLTATFKMTVGETSGMASLCIPYVTLEPIAGKLRNDQYSRYQAKQSDEVASAHRRNFNALPLEVDALLGTTEVTMEELLRLQTGDILDLGKRAKEPVELRVSGETKFLASPGLVGRHRGVSIQNELAKE